jgi:hypothetical protein
VLVNDTRNQHFLTRVEQKLNALNPQADARNLRIYSFEVIDRENYTLSLESPNGRPIGSNLSLFDLFSFDVPGNTRLRRNFESLFHKYEKPLRPCQGFSQSTKYDHCAEAPGGAAARRPRSRHPPLGLLPQSSERMTAFPSMTRSCRDNRPGSCR